MYRTVILLHIMLKKILIWAGGCLLLFSVAHAVSSSPQPSSPAVEQVSPSPEITTAEEEVPETISYTSRTEDDPKLLEGEERIVNEGKDGQKILRYLVTYTDGKETSRELLSEQIAVEPQERVVRVGTRKPTPPATATPRSYTNSEGERVQPPTYYNSAPEGATARCRDGTYSFSQSRRGTCSHHGGVAQWL